MHAADDSPEYGSGADPLTAYERARLRTTVDAAALERYLAVSGGAERRLAVAYFARELLVEDLPVLDPELAAEWTPPPAEFVTSDGRRFRSTISFDLHVQRELPELAALWAAVEPSVAGPSFPPDAG